MSGELVVRFRADSSTEQRATVLKANGATLSREMSLEDYAVVSVPEAQRAAIGQALAESGVVAVAEDVILRQPADAPNDPHYHLQWNFQDIGYTSAREVSDGSGVVVAVLDTGLAYENCVFSPGCDNPFGSNFAQAPDLATVDVIAPFDAFGHDFRPNDDYGHGSHVTGTIAQVTDNNYGAAGLAARATIMPVKICGWLDPTPLEDPPDAVQDYGCPTDRIAEGIDYAVANGARIINLSIGGGAGFITQAERDALANARSAGVVVIAAAGNGGTDKQGDPVLDYPAAVDSVISVGAVGVLGIRSSYSNYGLGEGGKTMDLVAPGGDVAVEGPISAVGQQSYATCSKATDYTSFNEVTPCQGTSMAAAHVTGVAALIKSQFPLLNATQIRALLNCSTLDLGEPGLDLQYGHGLVRADLALEDVDLDGTPDCIDTSTATPSPSPTPPANQCAAPSETASPSASPSASPTDSPTPSPTESATPTATPTPSVTPTAVPTGSPTSTPAGSGSPTETASPTETPPPTETPTPTSSATATPSPTPKPPGCGDVDCSGAVNGADALGVLMWLSQAATPACIGLGYVNCDGQLNAADVTTILRFSATLPLNLPAGCTGIE